MGKKKDDHQPQELSPQAKNRVSRVIEQMTSIPPSRTDPNGSYTGRPVDPHESPTQDADDL